MAGRPAYYDDPEVFSKEVDKYFETSQLPTWSGLALYLGFSSRDSLNDYKKKEGFSDPIKKALLRIESIYESNLFGRNPAGSIFALKNFGWKDKQEVEQSGGITIKYEEPTDYSYPAQDQSSDGISESI